MAGHFTKLAEYNPGKIIFAQGDTGREGYVVVSGTVELQIAKGKKARHVATVRPGEIFGEMAIIDAGSRSATAIAGAQGVRLAVLDAAQLIHYIAHQPAFALTVIELLTRRLRTSNQAGETPVLSDLGAKPAIGGAPEPPADLLRELGDGVYQIFGVGRSANSYLLKGQSKTVLIDAGLKVAVPMLTAALARINITPDSIDLVLLTHEHIDHVGGVGAFNGKAAVAAHAYAASKIRQSDEAAILNRSFGADFDPFRLDFLFSDKMVIDTGSHRLVVHETPGHSSGHVSFFEANTGLLFSGDCVMAGGHIGGVLGTGNLSDYIGTIELLASLGAKTMLPGHGRASDDPQADLARAAARCGRMQEDTREVMQALFSNPGFERLVRNAREMNLLYR